MLYELATISCPLMDLDGCSERARAWTETGRTGSEVLGCWRTDIGVLGRLLVLRAFDRTETLAAERERALLATAPFGARHGTDGIRLESFRRFPFLPPARPARRGKVYEFRTYRLEPGGVAATMNGWREALEPARDYTEHLVVAMYALDGAPRITHLWAFESLEQRTALRTAAYGSGVWPPVGGPQEIALATSTIALPEHGASQA